MQDPSSSFYSQIKSQVHLVPNPNPQFPEHEHLKCPRCDSTNTKFCYYNNYNLSQPRHYCKGCRRYWTKGGVLRNVPVGGGSRKSAKRSSRDSGGEGGGGGGEAAEPSAKRQASVGTKKKSGGEAETSSSSGLKKGVVESEANDAGHFGNLMDSSLSALLGSPSPSGGHFGNYADGLGCFAEPGSGPNMDAVILESGNSKNDGVEFLNVEGRCWW